MKCARHLSVTAMLALTWIVLLSRGNSDLIPAREPLSHLPHMIAGWSSRDVPVDAGTLRILGSGDFLSRIYSHPGKTEAVGLFIAYFPQQRLGATIHSPRHCLPGAGWDFESSQSVDLTDERGSRHRIGEHVIVNGQNRQFVIYWYRAHGRSIANEYLARLYLVTDAIRIHRTDGALVRVMTFIGPNDSISSARARAEAFVNHLEPTLSPLIPD